MALTSHTDATVFDVRRQLNRQSSSFAIGAVIWMLTFLPPLVLMLGVAFQPWVPPGDLLRDPLAVAEMTDNCCKVYFGAVSNLGIVLWMAGAAICLFAAAVIATADRTDVMARFLLAGGLLTGFLGFDDLFLIHENVLPAFGVPEIVTYGAYGLLGLSYLVFFWRQIFANRFVMFGVAGALLAASVTIDWVIHNDAAWRILLEDGAKITGITAWVSFHAIAAWAALGRYTGGFTR